MEKLCGLFGLTRQAWYEANWRQEKENMQDCLVLEQIQLIRQQLPNIGAAKLYFMLKDFLIAHQIKLGRDKLYALLRNNQLLKQRIRRKIRTTYSHPHFYQYPNLTTNLQLTSANQLWVSDITYIPIGGSYGYLSLVTDAYSRKIVGWSLQPNLAAKGVIEALTMALTDLPLKEKSQAEKGKSELIHHSDRGLQYCSKEYLRLLKAHYIRISMTEKGQPGENALAERVNGILKTEFELENGFISYSLALEAITSVIERYNSLRPHGSCNYLTPNQAHSQTGVFAKRWTRRNKTKPRMQTV